MHRILNVLVLFLVGAVLTTLTACDDSELVSDAPNSEQSEQAVALEQQTQTGNAAQAHQLSAEDVRRLLEEAVENPRHDGLSPEEAALRDSLLNVALQNVDAYSEDQSDVEYFYGNEALVKMGLLTEEDAADARSTSHAVLMQRLLERAAQENLSITGWQATQTDGGVEPHRICLPDEPPTNCDPPPPPPPPGDDPPGDDPPGDDPPDDVTWGGSSYAALDYDSFWNEFTATFEGSTWSSEPFDWLYVQTLGTYNGVPQGGYSFGDFDTGLVGVWLQARYLSPNPNSNFNFAEAISQHQVTNDFGGGVILEDAFTTRHTATYYLF